MRIIKVGLCLMRGRSLLLARSQGDAHFQIPGGKVEEGESDVQALVREIQEELGVRADPDTAELIGTFVAPAAGRPDMMVEVRLYHCDIEGEPQPSSEIAELHWQDVTEDLVPSSDVVRLHIIPHLASAFASR